MGIITTSNFAKDLVPGVKFTNCKPISAVQFAIS